MILPEFILPSKANQCWKSTGIDSLEMCVDKDWFKQYPHDVTYQYNSRGFRDAEWPDSINELQKSIWCVGDSFTVGIGSPIEHTWTHLLEQVTRTNTINISMDGASNNWIARHAVQILDIIKPTALVVQWSYLHRREGLTNLLDTRSFLIHYENVKGLEWPSITEVEQFSSLPVHIQTELLTLHDQSWRNNLSDEDLRLWHIKSDMQEDISNTMDCIKLVDSCARDTKVIHGFIPGFALVGQSEFYQQLNSSSPLIHEISPQDLARDGHHYDIITARDFADQVNQQLALI